jgi:L-2,4-diaminobutyrate decarboxylase
LFESEFLTSSNQAKDAYRRLLAESAQIVVDAWPNRPYVGKDPAALSQLVPAEFLPHVASSSEDMIAILSKVVANSVAVSDPAAAAHLHCPPLLASLAADVVISALNQSMDSFDQAPIASVVEQKMIRWLCGEATLPPSASGTFTTGGSQSNYMGLMLARDAFLLKQWNWSAHKSGLPPDARRLRILCSEVAHFTVEKSAAQLGLGTDAVVRIAVDDRFRMNPAAVAEVLDQLRAEKLLPMAIVATAGTTDFGSIDPLQQIAELAKSSGAWLHVDAAYGGALLFSPQHRNRLAGIESADSIAIDFHKLFWQPIPCSVFLVRDARHFSTMKMHADYLNPELHDQEGVPDLVTTSLLTSRRFDALKLWISFQSLGRQKLAAMIDRTIALANHAADVIRRRPVLELICEPQLTTVVFLYRPSVSHASADRKNAAIRQHLFDSGKAVIGHTRVRDQQCLKFTFMNPSTSETQVDSLIDLVVAEGDKLAES